MSEKGCGNVGMVPLRRNSTMEGEDGFARVEVG